MMNIVSSILCALNHHSLSEWIMMPYGVLQRRCKRECGYCEVSTMNGDIMIYDKFGFLESAKGDVVEIYD